MIKISLDRPIIPSNNNYAHTGTSWQISRVPDFTIPEHILLDITNDTTNLLSYKYNYTLSEGETLYSRVMFHFNNDTFRSKWSKVSPVAYKQQGIKMTGTVINTPKVTCSLSYTNNIFGSITATTSDMALYGGIGNHTYTNWVLTDSSNNIIWERTRDSINKTSITIPAGKLQLNKLYVLKAQHGANSGEVSNYGHSFISTMVKKTLSFDLEMPYNLVPNRYVYFRITPNMLDYASVDIEIRNNVGIVFGSGTDLTSRTPYIFSGDVIPGQEYYIWARAKTTDDNYTEWYKFTNKVCEANTIHPIISNIDYTDQYTALQESQFGGRIAVTSTEVYTGTVLLTKNSDNKIYRHIVNFNQLIEDKAVITLNEVNQKAPNGYVNITPLHNGLVLVDYDALRVVDISHEVVPESIRQYMIDNEILTYDYMGLTIVVDLDVIDVDYITRPRFELYRYNTITHTFTLLGSITRDDEVGSTSETNSLVVMSDNTVYYSPIHNVVSATDHTKLPVTIKKLNIDDMSIETVTTLPGSILAYPNLIKLDDDRIMYLNGSTEEVKLGAGYPIWLRNQNDIHIYTISTDSWANVATIDPLISNHYYVLNAQYRSDGKIVFFNNAMLGEKVGDQSTIVFNPVNYTFTIDTNDTPDDMIYQTTVKLRNGNILRISGRAIDPQVVYMYVNENYTGDIVIDDDIDVITDLIVPMYSTITIEDPYKYESITIQGTSDENSGKLRWINGDEMLEFKYQDLILTRDKLVNINIYNEEFEYKTVTILEDVEFNLVNYLHVPDNTDFTIAGPISVEYMIIGEGSDLTIT